jgi:hypothetical protein
MSILGTLPPGKSPPLPAAILLPPVHLDVHECCRKVIWGKAFLLVAGVVEQKGGVTATCWRSGSVRWGEEDRVPQCILRQEIRPGMSISDSRPGLGSAVQYQDVMAASSAITTVRSSC